jgi:hypothetical protein
LLAESRRERLEVESQEVPALPGREREEDLLGARARVPGDVVAGQSEAGARSELEEAGARGEGEGPEKE